ncbi:MAG: hypothetical protein ABJG55_12820 [Paracoccaceae bacterium]
MSRDAIMANDPLGQFDSMLDSMRRKNKSNSLLNSCVLPINMGQLMDAGHQQFARTLEMP